MKIMAHQMFKHDGFVSVKPAWHGLGIITGESQSSREAIEKAGLGWGVDKEPIYRFRPHVALEAEAQHHLDALNRLGVKVQVGDLRALMNWCVTVRGDLGFENPASDLGCVRESYTPIENAAAFDLIDRIVGGLGAKYETAGSLFNGKQIFLLARCPQDMQIADDVVRPYLLLSTAHDGSKALEVKFTCTRVVCWNTLSVALADASTATVRVKHTAGAIDAQGKVRQSIVDNARNGIGEQVASTGNADLVSSALEYITRQTSIFNDLVDRTVTKSFVRDYLRVLFPAPIKGNDTRAVNQRKEVESLFYGSKMPGNEQQAMRLDAGVGTAYRLYNALTHYNDHLRTTKVTMDKGTGQKKSFAEARFTRIMKADGLREDGIRILTEGLDTRGESLREALTKADELRQAAILRTVASN
jgi:phage/plasmid-like protein (TIGR03299 family)